MAVWLHRTTCCLLAGLHRQCMLPRVWVRTVSEVHTAGVASSHCHKVEAFQHTDCVPVRVWVRTVSEVHTAGVASSHCHKVEAFQHTDCVPVVLFLLQASCGPLPSSWGA
jgi:Na+-transporting NADH:ubiquinone oxidoreductase subunit NqrA